MTTSSPADGSVNSKCSNCGEAISFKAKFCPECGASQAKAAPAPIKCLFCGYEIPEFATFCCGCGATRNRVTGEMQKNVSANSTPKADEVSSSAFEPSTASGADSSTYTETRIPFSTTNQTPNPTEVGKVDERASKRRRLLIFSGIAAVVMVIALVSLVWSTDHPNTKPVAETPAESPTMGTPIDFASLYAKARSGGLVVGKRYQLEARVDDALTSIRGSNTSMFCYHDFDDPGQMEQVIRTAVNKSPDELSCTVVVSMGSDGELRIHRAENCR
jgi:hypothetical protein